MKDPSPVSSPGLSDQPSEAPLDSWKEIAGYVKRDVSTVQRWERREGMPIHRHVHDKRGSVYAFSSELDAWLQSRRLRLEEEEEEKERSAEAPPRSAIPTFLTRWTFVLLAAAGAVLAIGAILWFQRTEYFWRSPIANARVQTVTDFDGVEQDAAVSRDGHFVVFLSDRDGQMDVWVTQVGSGEFHNLTRGSAPELVNPSIRTLGFSPDGSLVTFWVRKQDGSSGGDISIWAVPTLGGEPRPYLKAWLSSTGPATAPDSRTTRPDPETRYSCQTAAGDRKGGPYLLRLPGSTVTFHCGRPTRHLSTSSRAPFQTNWIFGVSVHPAELLNGSRRTVGV